MADDLPTTGRRPARPRRDTPPRPIAGGTTPPQPTTTRHIVEVNEVKVFATGQGAEWWALFLLVHGTNGRITEVDVTLGGAICHVACDDRDHAQQLAAAMVEQHGLPRSAVRARVLRDGGAA